MIELFAWAFILPVSTLYFVGCAVSDLVQRQRDAKREAPPAWRAEVMRTPIRQAPVPQGEEHRLREELQRSRRSSRRSRR